MSLSLSLASLGAGFCFLRDKLSRSLPGEPRYVKIRSVTPAEVFDFDRNLRLA